MSASNTPEVFKELKYSYDKAISMAIGSLSSDIPSIKSYVEALEKFKDDIENERLLSKKYRVVSPYSNFPVENTVEFYYSSATFKESNFSKDDIKKISYNDIYERYIKDPELYNYLGHDYNWVCAEGGQGYPERKFNQLKFNNMIQHSSIVADYIKSDIKIKLSLIK